MRTATDSRAWLRVTVSTLFVCAIAGVVLTALFGFEQPNDTLLMVSSGLLLAAAGAVFAHLGFTRILTRSQKRLWLRRLTGRKAAWAWGDYLTCEDLRAAIDAGPQR